MDARKELSLINKHVRQHNRESSESVYWFEFVPLAASASAGSLYDDVYDEGTPGTGGRSYSSALAIPAVYIEEIEDKFTAQEEGRQVTQNISITILYQDALAAGLSYPAEYRHHLNDIVYYDNRYYKLHDYHVRGRLPHEVMIGVVGYEVFPDQEFMWDEGPPSIVSVDLPWPSTFPAVSV